MGTLVKVLLMAGPKFQCRTFRVPKFLPAVANDSGDVSRFHLGDLLPYCTVTTVEPATEPALAVPVVFSQKLFARVWIVLHHRHQLPGAEQCRRKQNGVLSLFVHGVPTS